VAVKIRLMRMGKTKQPTYRVVASDSRSPRNGRFIELLGTYQPRLEPSGINIDAEKTTKWIQNGAQPTERVQKLLEATGILTGDAAAKTQAAKKMAKRPAKQKTVTESATEESSES
jgi:small subunit ribosomal protein S16